VLPSLLNRESTLREWMEDPRGRRVFEPVLPQVMKQVQAAINGDQGGDNKIELETMNFLMELPLRDIFHFQVTEQVKSPDEFVDGLLAQVNQ
jgi:beta-glucosidase